MRIFHKTRNRLITIAVAITYSGMLGHGIAGELQYGAADLKIVELRLLVNGKVGISYMPKKEEGHLCPGVNFKVSETGVEIEFVRAAAGDVPEVSIPARSVKKDGKTCQFVVVPAKFLPVFLDDDGELIQLAANRRDER